MGNILGLCHLKEADHTFFNYKKTHCVVLMAIVNANCECLYCDTGKNGRISDGGVLNNTKFYEKLTKNELRIPKPRSIENSNTVLRYVFVGDEAFAMRRELLKPYRRDTITRERRIFNYRLSRVRCVVENTFGILASRFCIFHTSINLKMDNVDTVVLTCCALHIFLRRRSPQIYTPYESMDRENISEGTVELGCDPELVHDLQRGTRGQMLSNAIVVRDQFKDYFNNEGAVTWQDTFINFNG